MSGLITKNNVTKILILSMVATLVLLPATALGQDGLFGEVEAETPITTIDDVFAFLWAAFTIMYSLFFALAAFFILWSAFLYLMAGGDEEKVGTAKSTLIYSLIAVVIAVLSLGLSDVIVNIVENAAQN